MDNMPEWHLWTNGKWDIYLRENVGISSVHRFDIVLRDQHGRVVLYGNEAPKYVALMWSALERRLRWRLDFAGVHNWELDTMALVEALGA